MVTQEGIKVIGLSRIWANFVDSCNRPVALATYTASGLIENCIVADGTQYAVQIATWEMIGHTVLIGVPTVILLS